MGLMGRMGLIGLMRLVFEAPRGIVRAGSHKKNTPRFELIELRGVFVVINESGAGLASPILAWFWVCRDDSF